MLTGERTPGVYVDGVCVWCVRWHYYYSTRTVYMHESIMRLRSRIVGTRDGGCGEIYILLHGPNCVSRVSCVSMANTW